jgi:hypothetical protein
MKCPVRNLQEGCLLAAPYLCVCKALTDVTHCANRREIVTSVVVVPTYGTLNLTPIRNNPCFSCPVTAVRIMRIALVRMAMHYNSFYFGDLKRFCILIYDLSQFSPTFSFNLNPQAL